MFWSLEGSTFHSNDADNGSAALLRMLKRETCCQVGKINPSALNADQPIRFAVPYADAVSALCSGAEGERLFRSRAGCCAMHLLNEVVQRTVAAADVPVQ